MAMTIPMSRYKHFIYDRDDTRRWGQQFYDFLELQKVTSPFNKVWCDKLYEQDAHMGRQMVLSVIDHAN